jgi:ribosomal protein S18 acetylase RimI-like enzyme
MIKEIKKEELNNDFYDLLQNGFMYHYSNRPDLIIKRTKEELKNWISYEIDNSNLKILGYFKEDKLIGFLSYKIVQKVTKYLWIDEFEIAKDERRKGYGTELLEEVKKIARKENVKRIELNVYDFNKDAIRLYKKLGYTEQRHVLEMQIED